MPTYKKNTIEVSMETVTFTDELKTETQAYIAHVAACRTWGAAEKAKIGL